MKTIIAYIILLTSIGVSNISAQEKILYHRFKDSRTNLVGIIDESGKVIIQPRYLNLNPIYRYDSLVGVQIRNKDGIINLDEYFVIPPIYDYIKSNWNTDTLFRVTSGFPDGCKVKSWTISMYYTQGLSGYVNANNDTIIPIIYPHIGEFLDSEQVTEFTFGKFSDRLANRSYMGNPFVGRKWGLIDRKGNVVLKDDFYDLIFNMHSLNNLFYAYKGNKSTILNLRGEQLIPLKRRTYEQLYREYKKIAFW